MMKMPYLLAAAALISLSACKKPADAPLPEAAPPATAPAGSFRTPGPRSDGAARVPV